MNLGPVLRAAAVSAAVLAATVPAADASVTGSGSPGGAPIYTPPCTLANGIESDDPSFDNGGCAGYVATGRTFRSARAVIKVPADPPATPDSTAPFLYVGLSGSDSLAVAGIASCSWAQKNVSASCRPGTWVAVGMAGTIAGSASGSGGGGQLSGQAVTGIRPGDGVGLSATYNQRQNTTRFRITTPGGVPQAFSVPLRGAVFTHADALVDWSTCSSADTQQDNSASSPCALTRKGPPLPPRVSHDTLVTRFLQGGFTTTSGQHGTFAGQWALSPVKATSNAIAPSGGTVLMEPAYLWDDGLGNGWGDAFGVWLRA